MLLVKVNILFWGSSESNVIHICSFFYQMNNIFMIFYKKKFILRNFDPQNYSFTSCISLTQIYFCYLKIDPKKSFLTK